MNRTLVTRIGSMVALCAILTGGAGTAYALTTYSSYNTTVGKFNGNGYTGAQKKSTGSYQGTVKSSSVGGPYKVDAQMQRSDGSQGGSWVLIDDGTTAYLSNSIPAGTNARVRFSNALLTPVDVQVSGQFRVY